MALDVLRVAHLFAGCGGGMLGSEILGHESIFAVEIEEVRCGVLRRRRDEGGWFGGCEIIRGDIRDVDATRWQGQLDCISAGFPCQDISVAGRGAGVEGSRSGLVREVFRIADQARAPIVYLENSPAIRKRGRETIIKEFLARGYAWKDGTLSAADVGAGHKRNRWWFIAANADGIGKLESERRKFEEWRRDSYGAGAAPDTYKGGCQAGDMAYLGRDEAQTIYSACGFTGQESWWPVDAGIRGMVDGVPGKMDRIAMLGDSQVPLQAAVAWLLLIQ